MKYWSGDVGVKAYMEVVVVIVSKALHLIYCTADVLILQSWEKCTTSAPCWNFKIVSADERSVSDLCCDTFLAL